jgi:hypothetical protein
MFEVLLEPCEPDLRELPVEPKRSGRSRPLISAGGAEDTLSGRAWGAEIARRGDTCGFSVSQRTYAGFICDRAADRSFAR